MNILRLSRLVGALAAATVVILGAAVRATADPIVVPHTGTATEGNSNNLFPLATFGGVSFQQVYASAEFGPNPLLITGMAFRPDADFGTPFSLALPDARIFLSTTAAAVDGLSEMLPSNVGPDNLLVQSGPLWVETQFNGPATGPKDFDIQIPFTSAFLYKPTAGNLLLWMITEHGVNNEAAVDAVFTAGDSVSRALNFGPGYTTHRDTIGLVTRFDATAVPEPTSIALLGTGLVGLFAAKRRTVHRAN